MNRPLSVTDIVAAVRVLPDNQCASDPMPMRILKGNVKVQAPFLVEMFNTGKCLAALFVHFQICLCHATVEEVGPRSS